MTFKFFDHMESILGDRRTVQGQSTSSTFTKNKSKLELSTMLSTFMAQSDTSISLPSRSSNVNTSSALRNELMKVHQNQEVYRVKIRKLLKR